MNLNTLMRAFRPRPQPGWMVFARDERELRRLHVVLPAEGRPQVLLCQQSPTAPTRGQALATPEMGGRTLRRHRCLATLSLGEYQIVRAETPDVPPEELRSALRWSVREMLDYPVDEAGMDYLPIPADRERAAPARAAHVVCSPRPALRRWVTAFDAVRARLHAIDVAETAHRNLAALDAPEGRAVALLGVMPDACLLTFAFNGELCLSRRIDVGLGALLEAGEERRRPLFDQILLEVQRSLDGFDRQFHFLSLARLRVSPLPAGLDLLRYLADNLDVRVEPLDLEALVDFSAVPALREAAVQARFLTLLGAALRPEESAP
ncbi:MAG: agglutinin biogenesis protein MshI [Betaproteobacteria bacterium]|nr:agglutinin biogenesis protein MshI [Betaproteobacteria bacterium]